MINTKYKIELFDDSSNGGYCTLYYIKDHSNLGFKEFISKSRAEYARKIQFKLSKLNLAPKVNSKICKLKYNKLFPDRKSGWGYVTELADVIRPKSISLRSIQTLVDNILKKTKLKFWDCHWDNLGFITRNHKKYLVCIDTGKETWDGDANYFGNTDPGPKCGYCLKYKCKCMGD
jgi:hypothetical protein